MVDSTRTGMPNVMIPIKLTRATWRYDSQAPLGRPGGFGTVYAGVGESGASVAVKRLRLEPSPPVPRELRIAEELIGREFTHVLPFLDYGYDATSNAYFIVMERAERSLQDAL